MGALAAELEAKAREVMEACQTGGATLAIAESCTGGLVAAALTAIPGSSSFVERGFVTYSNEAKVELLGVSPSLIESHGAVSEEVARAMAEGALTHSHANVSVAITGIAGPTGGSEDKPVGTVHLAAARQGQETRHRRLSLSGNRDGIRLASALAALDMLRDRAAV